jgi:amino acid transporter/mannitol/fructose-specific phosphotransferase system IIA component (Ntr-type)
MPDKQNKKLTRLLSGVDVFCISTGAMISSGLFVLPGLVFAEVGPAVILAYIFAGLFILPALFAKAELATAMPKAGGSYFFIERSMGSAAGTIGGLASWLSLSLKSAFALVGIGAFASLIYPNISEMEIKIIAVGCCLFFTALNLVSVKSTGKVQIFLVIFLIILLSLYIFRGAMMIDVHKLTPFMPYGPRSFFAACGMVFISFGGLTKAASVAEEVRDPSRNIPLGMISAFSVVLLLYGLTTFVTVGLLDKAVLAHSLTPISSGGYKIFGPIGSVMMAFAGIFAFVSTANAGILAASRFPLAMSRDQLLPDFFSHINKRYKTPHYSILATGIFMIATIFFLDLGNLVKVASTMKIILFIFVLLAAIVMRESRILNYKPAFVSPLYPWIHIAGIISYCFFLYQMGIVALAATGVFIVASILWHKIYFRGKIRRKSALIHIVERITSKEIIERSLSVELREILEERDNIIEDRFDNLVKKCDLIDIPRSLTSTEFFVIVADKLSERLNMDTNQIFDALVLREQDSTTVIRPGLAIPHIIVDGKQKFELLIARCNTGINFTEDSPPVYAAFILVGSRDERNFHLQALSAIAQTVQDENFDKNWLRAKNIEDLRDIMLLSKRRRGRD